MKGLIPLMICAAVSGCASTDNTQQQLASSNLQYIDIKEKILGSWQCTTVSSSSQKTAFNADITYLSDGGLDTQAISIIQNPKPMDAYSFNVSAHGKWKLEDGKLVENNIDFDVKANNDISKPLVPILRKGLMRTKSSEWDISWLSQSAFTKSNESSVTTRCQKIASKTL
ncbi:hypothetical protein [Enterovibrio norvegicus]|uniref:Lipoprotein n=1 Tax=Enterovibrio norvegicus TaxID=188144 RepID=A0ABV4KYJ1_9GAMM|nr:hypothetical protein [Enterovibrio norvegicus]